MAVSSKQRSNNTERCVDDVIRRVGKNITLGLPLGLGKPVRFVNALYQRAKDDPEINLHIFTALSLLAPSGSSSLEKRFMGPFAERLYGGIPVLQYAQDVNKNNLPPNVQVSEFFFKAGSYLNNRSQQRHYVSTNYTHAVRDLMDLGVNVVAQMVAPGELHGAPGMVSLSCNPDLSLDLLPLLRERETAGTPVAIVGEINRQMPWFGRDAAIAEDEFDMVFEHQASEYPLFSAPQMAISPADHMIGFYASTLLKDGGTLQVGIGSLGAALVHSTILRHKNNAAWRAVYDNFNVAERFPLAEKEGGTGPFDKGLYGCSEMMVDGFLYLMEAGVLRREVYDHADLQILINNGNIEERVSLDTLDVLRREGLIDSPMRARDVTWLKRYGILRDAVEFKGGRLRIGDHSLNADLDDPEAREAMASLALGERLTGGVAMHGGFYVGPQQFYQSLRELSDEDRDRICMTSVSYINHLYDHRFGNQRLKAAQRIHSRFINTAMMYTLGGAAVSDGLEDGRVISGVGGQYNFVSMAHELPGARSIIALRSSRNARGRAVSNIVFSYGHCTIPRHLRDVVITEYGMADLRGQPDEQVYLRLIRIADSRFQQGLLEQAQKAGKVDAKFRLPASWLNNTPDAIARTFAEAGGKDWFPPFPFGRDFTDQELVLGKALKKLKAETSTRRGKLATLMQAVRAKDEEGRYAELLQRMGLHQPSGLREKLDQRLVIHGLQLTENPTDTGKSKA
ncbi:MULTISPECIES: acetyl-CoA hydrolase/transferase C-terminal domain-containing protein [Marinobacter]|uniref:Acetyl-CoA hydrolase/transferase C-terminal domain-containing protein n=1 Tax=Marinobacter xiaoshiensis TaxID=3073652 RepID=A0ABU2HL81_9GAMM|nr:MULTISPECIES: acetyl-CoA hydrolase/transferase C-terminal domain-containing protein [unclassified Marinobacter]MBK1872857.1 acetyl-CoA hydrolase [Marinobacter sp. 1-3A]MBK1886932.1 acetyl-CoA hydrolase [Marinobacter sp. DY40_1A1]MDS1311830.1 acetyl-CoA hydrolase/transferase C-terminal domain-containing protein [Marinobacter sp. F60267]